MTAPAFQLDPYRLAQLNARAAAGNLTAEATRRIQAAVEAHSKAVAARIAQLAPLTAGGQPSAALVAAQAILTEQAQALEATLQTIIGQNRSASFGEVLGHWGQANERAVAALSSVPRALAGAVQLPNLTLAGVYEGLGNGAGTWKSLLQGHISNAAQNANTIVRAALLDGTSPETLARRLRPYLAGSKPFHEAFGGDAFSAVRNLQAGKVPPHLRNAAGKLARQARRIGYSEIWNARAEAELQHFAADPLIEAIRWTLSPFRGQLDGPDICDMLARNDIYGLGRGVYPLGKAPLPPHPYDRCERRPVLRPVDQAALPKPQGDRSGFGWQKAELFEPGRGTLKKFTAAQATEARAQLFRHIATTDQAAVSAGLDKIMADIGMAQAKALLQPPAIKILAESDKALMASLFKATPDLSPTAAFKTIKADFPETALTPQKVNSFKQAQKAKAKKAAAAAAPPPEPPVAAAVAQEDAVKAAVGAKAKKPPPSPKPGGPDLDTVLGTQIQGPSGSNVAGPSGLWRGTDGVKRYVKQYGDAGQAYAEKISNELYRQLGIHAPKSGTVVGKDGKLLFWSEFIEDTKGTLSGSLTKATADKVLDGYAADVLLMNWDAVGTGLDNIVLRVGGQAVRIDQGGSLLWRAQGARKPTKLLNGLGEWESLAEKNTWYSKVFQKAGVGSKADMLGQRAIAQIDDITAVRQNVGGWAKFVDDTAPGLAKADRDAIVEMLEARTTLLAEKRAQILAQTSAKAPKAVAIKPPKPPAPIGTPAKPHVPATPAVVEAAGKTDKALMKAIFDEDLGTSPKKALAQIQAEFPDTTLTYSKVNSFKQGQKAKAIKAAKAPEPVPLVWASDKEMMQGLVYRELLEEGAGGPAAIFKKIQAEFPDTALTSQKVNSFKQAQKAKLKAGKPIPNPKQIPGDASMLPKPNAAALQAKKELTQVHLDLEDLNKAVLQADFDDAYGIASELENLGIHIDPENLIETLADSLGELPPGAEFDSLADMIATINKATANPTPATWEAVLSDKLVASGAADLGDLGKKIKKAAGVGAPLEKAPLKPVQPLKGIPAAKKANAPKPSKATLADAFENPEEWSPTSTTAMEKITAKAIKGQSIQDLAVLHELGGDPVAFMAKAIESGAISAQKVSKATSNTFWKLGVGIKEADVAALSLAQKQTLLRNTYMALAGDTGALQYLETQGFLTTSKLKTMLKTAKIKAAKKAKAFSKNIPGVTPVPADKLPSSITEEQMLSFVADSDFKSKLYFSGSTTTNNQLAAGAIDITKGPGKTGPLGHGFYLNAQPTATGVLKPQTYVVKIKNSLVGTPAEAKKAIAKLAGANPTPAQIHAALVAEGYDSIVLTLPGGNIQVIALDPKIVKHVKLPPPAPKPKFTPKKKKVYGGPQQQTTVEKATYGHSGAEGATDDFPKVQGSPKTPKPYVRSETSNTARLNKDTHLDNWSIDERKALRAYTGNGYTSMNAALRAKPDGIAAKGTRARVLQDAIERSRLDTSVIVYRSISSGNPLRKVSYQEFQKHIGEVIKVDKGFLSTSTNSDVARRFGGTGWVLEIRVPKGSKAAWTKKISQHKSENELLLQANTKLCLVEVRDEGYSVDGAIAVRIIVEVCNK